MSPRVLAAILLFLLAVPAAAQDPAPAPTVGVGTWPRLFFTPEERRRVTLQRQAALDGGRLVEAGPLAEEGASPIAATRPAAPRVDGISLVRGARFAAWIGGRRVEDGGLWDGYRLRVTRDGVQFIDATGAARLVKVGQPVRPPGRGAP